MTRAKSSQRNFFSQHSLSVSTGGILLLWFVLYRRADASTHVGAFFGNAIADWLGMFTFVIATKYFYEIGSKESRRLCQTADSRRAAHRLHHPDAVQGPST